MPSGIHAWRRIGFGSHTDGFDLLPDHIQDYPITTIKAATKKGQCTFLFQPKTQCESTLFLLKLMHLRHGQLHTLIPNLSAKNSCDDSSNNDNDTIQELPHNVDFSWCQYPLPRTGQE